MAGEVDQNVNVIAQHGRRRLRVVELGDILPMVDAGSEAIGHVVGSSHIRVGKQLNNAAVMRTSPKPPSA